MLIWKIMYHLGYVTLWRKAFRAARKSFSVSSEQQPPRPTQVVQAHRISCRKGRPQELNIYFQWFPVLVPTFYFRDGRIGVHIAPKSVAQKPQKVWFLGRRKAIESSVIIALLLCFFQCQLIEHANTVGCKIQETRPGFLIAISRQQVNANIRGRDPW